MSPAGKVTVLIWISAGVCCGARCTTIADPTILRAYEGYVATVEAGMPARFNAGELSWTPPTSAKAAVRQLVSGGCVRQNLSDESFNRRIADRNGAVIHWIGAIRILDTNLAELQSVLADFESYPTFYRPMIFEARVNRNRREWSRVNELTLGLRSVYRFASLFPQHYAFQARGDVEFDDCCDGDSSAVRAHLRATIIRESDSGVPGRNDLLPAYQDHGIMWGLNAYWRARRLGRDVYLEFETITLARSVQVFACKIGMVPIPKSAIASAMDSLPAESVTVILEGTKAECRRRAALKNGGVSGR
jgi:hypothetical protein